MSQWTGVNFPGPPSVVESIKPVVDTVTGALNLLIDLTIIATQIASFLISLAIDPINSVLEFALDFLEDLIQKLAALGFYLIEFIPDTLDPRLATGYQGFVRDLERSLYDPGDVNKPILSDDVPFFAVAAIVSVGLPDIQRLNDEFQGLARLFDGLLPKFDGLKGKAVPQTGFMGILDPPPNREPKTVLQLSVVENDVIAVSQSGWVSFPDDERVVLKKVAPYVPPSAVYKNDVYPEPGKFCFIMAVKSPIAEAEGLNQPDEASVKAIPVGDVVVAEDGSYEVKINLFEYPFAGTKGVILASVEYSPDGKILRFDPSFNVKIPPLDLEGKLRVRGDSQKPDWRAFASLRDWSPMKDFIEIMNQSMRKFQTPVDKQIGVEYQLELLNNIKAYLTDIQQRVNQVSETLKQMFVALSVGVNFLWVTPWPTLFSEKDPFNIEPGSKMSFTLDPITAGGGSPQEIEILAESGYHTSSDKIVFDVPDNSSFNLEMTLKRAIVDSGSAAETLGLDTGAQTSQGVFQGSTQAKIRIPNALSGIKLSTFSNYLALNASSVLSMLGISPGVAPEGQYNAAFNPRYHYPSGASLSLSVWSNDTELTGGTLLPYIGMSSYTKTSSGSLVGNPIQEFKIVPDTAFRLSTRSLTRSYPSSSVGILTGISSPTALSRLQDQGVDARIFDVSDLATLRFSMGIKNLEVVSGDALPYLGLDSATHSVGSFVGEEAFKFTSPEMSFKFSARANTITLTPTPFLQTLRMDGTLISRGSVLGINSRFFSWEEGSGFSVTVLDPLSQVVYTGEVRLTTAGTLRTGSSLAIDLTQALRAVPGALGTEFCQYNDSTGLFTFFFSGAADSVAISGLPDPEDNLFELLGLAIGNQPTTSGLIVSQEPVNYSVPEDSFFTAKFGEEEFEVEVPQGTYRGSELSNALETALRSETGRLEQVSYNLSTGRFSLLLDPVGYTFFEEAEIELAEMDRVAPADLISELNQQLDAQEIPGEFSFNERNLIFSSGGMTHIEFVDLTGDSFSVLGLTPGISSAVDSFSGATVKNFYFKDGTRSLVLRKNRTDYSFNLPQEIPLSFEEVIADIKSYVSGLSVTFPQNALNFVLNDTLMLVLDQIIVMGPGDSFTEADIAQELQDQLHFFIGDALAEVSAEESSFSVYYPEMTTFSLHVTGLGEDLLAILGFNPGSPAFTETFIGGEYKPYRITPLNNDFQIVLGSVNTSVTIPSGRKSGSLLASQLSSAVAGVSFTYDRSTGTYFTNFLPAGYTQIDNQLVTLSPGMYNALSLSSHVTALIRSLPNAMGTETVLNLPSAFAYFDPQTVSITLSDNTGSFKALRPLGFAPGNFTLVNNRYTGSTPIRFFIDGSNNTAVYSVYTSTVNVSISNSLDYETGAELAQRLTDEFNSQTGQNESFLYLDASRTFILNPPSSGFQLLDNEEIALPANSGFITPQDLASAINSEIPSGIGLTLSYDTAQKKFFWDMDGLSRVDLSAGSTGYSLLEFLGFGATSYQTPNAPVYSTVEPKNLVITSASNQLSIQLGGNTHNVVLTPDTQVYTLTSYMDLLQTEIQALSERGSIASTFSSNTAPWIRFQVAPGGEYRIKSEEVTGFPSGTFTTLTSFSSTLTGLVQALPQSSGSEFFSYDISEDKFYFEDTSGLTVSISFEDSANTDLKKVLGASSQNYSLTSGRVIFSDPAQFVITSENEVLGYDLNGVTGTISLPNEAYTGLELASVIQGLIPSAIVSSVSWSSSDMSFTITAKEEGSVYFNNIVVLTPSYTGDPDGLADLLTAQVSALSSGADEDFFFISGKFEIYKPDLYSVKATSDSNSPYEHILRHIGLTPDVVFTAEPSSPGIVKLGIPAPYNITSSSNSLKVALDTLEPFDVSLEQANFPLTGPQVASRIETAINHRLNSLSVKHILHRYNFTLVDQFLAGVPGDPRFMDFKVCEKVTRSIETRLSDVFFNTLGQSNKDAVNALFAPPSAQASALLPKAAEAYNQILSTATSATNAFNNYQKGLLLLRYNAFANRAFIEILDNCPEDLDATDLQGQLGPVVDAALETAATAEGLPVNDIPPTVWQNQKLLWRNILISSIDDLLNRKYFNEVTCTYDDSLRTFTVTSPTKGTASKVSIAVADSEDIADYFGFTDNLNSLGTGNVSFSHIIPAKEISRIISSQTDLNSYTWSLSYAKMAEDILQEDWDDHYPFRYYTRDEVPISAYVVTHPVSINWGSSATIDVASVSGNALTELGFPTNATGVSGAEGFVGAFRQAGPPESVPDNDQAYVAAVVAVAAVPSPTDTLIAPILDTFENIATVMGLKQNG